MLTKDIILKMGSLSMNKAVKYIQHILCLVTGNKLRLILSLVGFSVGLFVFSSGNFMVNNFYLSMMREIEEMPDNAMFVQLPESELGNFFDGSHDLEYPIMECISSVKKPIYEGEYKETYIHVTAKLHGLTGMRKYAIEQYDGYGDNLININLVTGRKLTEAEIRENARVCVINEFAAELLYGSAKEAVGKYIVFNKYNIGFAEDNIYSEKEFSYQIVGVIKNNYYARKEMELLDRMIRDGGTDLDVSVPVFCPFYFTEYWENGEDTDLLNLVWEKNEHTISNIPNIERKLNTISNNAYITPTIYDKNYEKAIVEKRLAPVKFAFNVFIISLILLSGIFNMSILFFSFKERTREIGIKKAFGASTIDILFQFTLENIIIMLCSLVISILVSFYVVMTTSGYIQANLFTDYKIYVDTSVILRPILVGLVECAVFTTIPAVVFSSIKPVEALKIDV